MFFQLLAVMRQVQPVLGCVHSIGEEEDRVVRLWAFDLFLDVLEAVEKVRVRAGNLLVEKLVEVTVVVTPLGV